MPLRWIIGDLACGERSVGRLLIGLAAGSLKRKISGFPLV